MKKIALLAVLLLSGTYDAVADKPRVEPAKGLNGRGTGAAREGKRDGWKATILQVLPEGLLMKGGYLLTGHPEHKKLADGQTLNFYAVNTGKVFKYVDTTGAERTVRIYRWDGKRTGG